MPIYTPASGSIIENSNGTNRTGTGLSTNIVIRVGPNAVGAIQTLHVGETRTITPVDELGTDGHIDVVPTRSTDISGTCSRVRYDRLRVAEAFSRGFLHVGSQRIGFDIDIYDEWNGDANSMIVTTLKDVWISSISYNYQKDNWIIIDEMAWTARTIYTSIQGSSAAIGGSRNLVIQTDSLGVERAADVGKLQGALDAPGIINSVFTGF